MESSSRGSYPLRLTSAEQTARSGESGARNSIRELEESPGEKYIRELSARSMVKRKSETPKVPRVSRQLSVVNHPSLPLTPNWDSACEEQEPSVASVEREKQTNWRENVAPKNGSRERERVRGETGTAGRTNGRGWGKEEKVINRESIKRIER